MCVYIIDKGNNTLLVAIVKLCGHRGKQYKLTPTAHIYNSIVYSNIISDI